MAHPDLSLLKKLCVLSFFFFSPQKSKQTNVRSFLSGALGKRGRWAWEQERRGWGGCSCLQIQTASLLCTCHIDSVVFLTLCDPIGGRPPGLSVHRILQAGVLSGLPFPPPGGLPDPGMEPASLTSPALAAGGPGMEPASLTSPALAAGFFITSASWEQRCRLWRAVDFKTLSPI